MNTITTLTDDEVNNQNIAPYTNPYITMPNFEFKNIIILILVILLVSSLVSINIFQYTSNILKYITNITHDLLGSFLSAFAYITGVTLNTTTDVIGDTAKTGIDIAETTLQRVGTILIDASKRDYRTEVSDSIETSKNDKPKEEPEPDTSGTNIQNPITSKKTNWCLVGNQNQRRYCASVKDADKCMSGDIFPTHKMCLNPNLNTNVLPEKQRVTLSK